MRALFDHYTDAGNIGGDATIVYADTLKSGTLGMGGDKLILEYLINSSVSSFTLAIKVGGYNVLADAGFTLAEGDNHFRIVGIRGAGQSNGRFYITYTNTSGSTVFYRSQFDFDAAFQVDGAISVSLQDTSETPVDNTVVAKMGTVLFIPAS